MMQGAFTLSLWLTMSISLRSLSAVVQSLASKPRLAEESGLDDTLRAIGQAAAMEGFAKGEEAWEGISDISLWMLHY